MPGLVAAVVGLGLVAAGGPASADTAPAGSQPATVAADGLPTVQVNGVVWSELVVGNTVYATGSFSSARPAGSPAGTNETPRGNILAFDLTTGNLITSWAPSLNAQGLKLAASPDGSTIYVVGDFTAVNGVNRYRIAALDASTGDLITSFAPALDARARAIAVTASTVYVGGIFSIANGVSRTRLAAFDSATGALLSWAPTADDEVVAMTLPAGSNRVIVGGRFTHLSGVSAYGSGALDADTGAVGTWHANTVILDAGSTSTVSNLWSDGSQVYGTAYDFGSSDDLDVSFSATIATGDLIWVNGCRGDMYDTAAVGGVDYVVGHAHDCSALGAFQQTNPWTYQRALAVSTGQGAGGKLNAGGKFPGQPAPDLYHWQPTLAVGTYTGQNQAAWSVAATSQYVVLGGEFPTVNGVAQQGLVRFAVSSVAPNKQGPQGYSGLTPSVLGIAPGTVRIGWTAAWDRDNAQLTYQLLRGATLSTSTVIDTVTAGTDWWNRPTLSFLDTTAPAGSTQTYRVRVTDPFGNVQVGPTAGVTVPAGSPTAITSDTYLRTVRADGPNDLWRLDEASGITANDWAGGLALTLGATETRGVAGALAGNPDTATGFSGKDTVPGTTTASTAITGPGIFSLEAWFKTTTKTGGKIIGFGNSSTGSSTNYDRHVYMTNAGTLVFGVYPGGVRTVTSPKAYNDGAWHHVVATLSTAGMVLYVDGAPVASRTDTFTAQAYNGQWRVGGDTIASSWPSAPSTSRFTGTLDEVAVYPTALTAAQVLTHYQAGTGTLPNNVKAAFTSTSTDLQVAVDATGSTDTSGTITSYRWDFGDASTGTGATATHVYAAAGTYTVTLTATDNTGASSTATGSVTVNANPGNTYAADSFTRTVSSGLGSADVGGPWSVSGSGVTTSTDGSTAVVTANAGGTATMRLPSVSSASSDLTDSINLAALPTGGGVYLSTIVRASTGGDYRARVKILATGAVQLSLTDVIAGTETVLAGPVTVAGLTYMPGTKLDVHAQAVGTGPTTLQVRVWADGGAEPTGWQLSTTDATSALQGAGAVGFATYLSGSATAALTAHLDDLVATRL